MISDDSDTIQYFLSVQNKGNFEKQYKIFLKKSEQWFFERVKNAIPNYSKDDFTILKSIGTGSYGLVVLVKHKSGVYHAMKSIQKHKVVTNNKIEYIKTERTVLHGVRFPFSVHLNYSSHDNSYIYFIMPFVAGGEMFTHIGKLGKFTELQSKFYAAQVVLVLEYLHCIGLVYRDLKPENILIDHEGYLKITDYGSSKFVKTRTWSLVGTPEYLAPEIYYRKGYGNAIDWWALGVLIYEMSFGSSPFHSKDDTKIVQNILKNNYRFPEYFSVDQRDIIHNLLQNDLSKRFGNLKNGANDIKNHKWFRQIDWFSLLKKQLQAPFLPEIIDPADTSNFVTETIPNFVIDPEDTYAAEFADF